MQPPGSQEVAPQPIVGALPPLPQGEIIQGAPIPGAPYAPEVQVKQPGIYTPPEAQAPAMAPIPAAPTQEVQQPTPFTPLQEQQATAYATAPIIPQQYQPVTFVPEAPLQTTYPAPEPTPAIVPPTQVEVAPYVTAPPAPSAQSEVMNQALGTIGSVGQGEVLPVRPTETFAQMASNFDAVTNSAKPESQVPDVEEQKMIQFGKDLNTLWKTVDDEKLRADIEGVWKAKLDEISSKYQVNPSKD